MKMKSKDFENNARLHYDFELARRAEINENLTSTMQASFAMIGFLVFVSSAQNDPKIVPIGLQYSFWISSSFIAFSLIISAVGILGFATRFPDSPKILNSYYKDLIEHDASTADDNFGDFLKERWIENASVNSVRNRWRSACNFYARLLLLAACIPLAWVAIQTSKVPFPL